MSFTDIDLSHFPKEREKALARIERYYSFDVMLYRSSVLQHAYRVNYSYRALLEHARTKDCIEAQLVAYADRVDAYCESIHEVLAGNYAFVWSLMFYDQWGAKFPQKLPMVASLFAAKSPFIVGDNRYQPHLMKARKYTQFGSPHTIQSIKKPTEFAFYDAWRELVRTRGGEEGVEWLTKQKEFLRR